MKPAILVLALTPITLLGGMGYVFLSTPLRQPLPATSGWFEVADLDSLPADGVPRRRPVLLPRHDAWTRLPDRPLGNVFVRKLPDCQKVTALRADHHPIYRIPVKYDSNRRVFQSCCWRVEFDVEGKEIQEPGHPALFDDMENLAVRLQGGKVLVEYKVPK